MWSALVKLALMGTDRKTPTVSQLQMLGHPTLNQTIQQLDWSVPERAILEAAGAIALYQQAGQGPRIVTTQQSTPVHDSRPLCSTQTTQHLRQALHHDPELCRDILQGITTANQQIPPEFLPTLLNVGDRYHELQGAIHHCIGPRGRWLAAQNPNWQYAHWDWFSLPPDPTHSTLNPQPSNTTTTSLPHPFIDLWQTGTPDQRVTLCQQWRNIAPNSTRELIATEWAAEAAHMRSQLIATLAIELSLADEAFLEIALTDRSAAVRATAAHLLASLPDSYWCQQMTKWGRFSSQNGSAPSVLTIHSDDNGLCIDVALPILDTQPQAKSFPSMLSALSPRMGTKRSSASQQEQQQEWLAQIIGCTSLIHWQQYGSSTDLIRAAAIHPQGAAILHGWNMAALRQRHQSWADTLLQHQLSVLASNRSNRQQREAMVEWLTALFLVLPPPRREALLTAYIPPATHHQTSLLHPSSSMENGAADGEAIAQWLQLAIAICPRNWPDARLERHNSDADYNDKRNLKEENWTGWSQDFSHTVLAQLQRDIAHNHADYIRQMQTLARDLGLRLAPTISNVEAMTTLDTLDEGNIPGSPYQQRLWQQTVEIMRSLLSQRYAIWQEWPGVKSSSGSSGL